MKILVIFLILFCNAAFANPLDVVVTRINNALNPKSEGAIGYEVEYRQEIIDGYTWINITQVKKTCKVENIRYLESGNVLSKHENRCITSGSNPRKMKLWQISCHTSRGKKCLDKLAKEVSVSVVNKIVSEEDQNFEVE